MLLKFKVLPNGDLSIAPTVTGKDVLLALRSKQKSNPEIWAAIMSDDSGYRMAQPGEIEAMTVSPIITDNRTYWWLRKPVAQDDFKVMLSEGRAIFSKAAVIEEQSPAMKKK